MSVLNATEIRNRMKEVDYSEKLLISPLLSDDQIGPASVDVRLGSSIIIPRKTYVEQQDVTNPKIVRQVEQRRYDRKRLRYHSRFMLHPHQLILGVTFEFLSLPYSICCQIVSRSSWGRLGLVVATAAMVQPGYKGCLTLELVNVSESPIALYPGLPVGQLVFHEVALAGEKTSYEGRYDCPTEAELPKFYVSEADDEMQFWGDRAVQNDKFTR